MQTLGKVLVTGGAGYIGAHTVLELCQQGYEPVVIDNLSKSDTTLLEGIKQLTGKPISFHQGDCASFPFMSEVFDREGDFLAVMHFAAYKAVGESVHDPLKYYRNNICSLLTLLEVMKLRGTRRLIFSSSCTVYGNPSFVPVDEQTPFGKSISPYGATKQVCEQILQDVSLSQSSMKIFSLRYFNPIGAHPSGLLGEKTMDRPSNLVPYITGTAMGKYDSLVVFGNDYDTPDGTCIRDFIHVVDLARAHVFALRLDVDDDAPSLRAYNIGTGQGVSVLELINQFIDVTGIPLRYQIGSRRPGDVACVYADATKARQELGWVAQYTVADALKHAWSWEKN